MATTREAIETALFNLVSASGAYTTKSRRIQSFADVAPNSMPAIFQVKKNEQYIDAGTGVPTKKIMLLDLYIYAWEPLNSAIPATQMNSLLDALDTALKPLPSMLSGTQQTLGGLVYDCQIDGTIETDEGTLGQKSVAIVPIKIIVNH